MKTNIRLEQTEKLIPLHEVEDFAHYQKLVNAMSNGWSGEPLLGVEMPTGKIQLLTGSHRYAAAATLCLEVPVYCVKMSESQAEKACCDWQDRRAEVVAETGDAEAIRIFEAELKDGR